MQLCTTWLYNAHRVSLNSFVYFIQCSATLQFKAFNYYDCRPIAIAYQCCIMYEGVQPVVQRSTVCLNLEPQFIWLNLFHKLSYGFYDFYMVIKFVLRIGAALSVEPKNKMFLNIHICSEILNETNRKF